MVAPELYSLNRVDRKEDGFMEALHASQIGENT
jgi:hypothetical protein